MILEKWWLFYRDTIEEKPISTKKWTMIAPVLNPPHSEDMIEVTWNFFQSIWNVVALPTLWAKGSQGTSEHSQGGTTGYFENATFDISERQANHYLKKADLFHWTVLCFSTTFYAEATEFSKSSITKTWRAQEFTWKKKQGVCVWCEILRSCGEPRVEYLVDQWVNIWEHLMANPKTIVPVSIHVGIFEWTCVCPCGRNYSGS